MMTDQQPVQDTPAPLTKPPPMPIPKGMETPTKTSLPPAPPTVVQVIDHMADIVAILAAFVLCVLGKATFLDFALFSGGVLGIQGTARGVLAKLKPAGVTASGLIGLATLGIGLVINDSNRT